LVTRNEKVISMDLEHAVKAKFYSIYKALLVYFFVHRRKSRDHLRTGNGKYT